jgi:uncharacterized membrane protein YphA (DoxX/SURF4 family)
MDNTYSSNLTIISTILITIVFIISAIPKIINFQNTAFGLKSQLNSNMSMSLFMLVIVIAIIIELGGSLIVLYSTITSQYRMYAYYSVFGLIIFTTLATLIYHRSLVGNDYYAFFKNIAIIGGLLLLSEKLY